jgi:hypothetical protein
VNASRSASAGRWAWLLAAVFLVGHLSFLAPTLEDIDSVNFALGVRDFDVSLHQPHPPGYPVYIALGKLSRSVAAALGSRPEVIEARSLAVWSALFGALAAWALVVLFGTLEANGSRAWLGALVTVTCPLVWMNGSRPMSDVPGFAVATVAQALLALALVKGRDGGRAGAADRDAAALVSGGALVAAVGIGLRSQVAWLTVPLLLVVVGDRVLRRAHGGVLMPVLLFAAGVLAWFVPMVIASGGPAGYLTALGLQAGEDFAGVPMLWLQRTPRRLLLALTHSFVLPWASKDLARVVLVLAGVGALALLARSRRAVLIALACWLPYTVFHLLFQETVTTRYALPIVPAVAYLAVRALSMAGRWPAFVGAVLIATVSLAITVPAQRLYARDGAPVARAWREIQGASGTPHMLALHHSIARALRGEAAAAGALPSPVRTEWLELAKYWKDGGDLPVWWIVDPRRTEVALIDPAARTRRGEYRWPFRVDRFLAGIRPADADWVEIAAPGWFAGQGWALTPETAGLAARTGHGPAQAPVEAWVRRRSDPATLLVGGRNLGRPGDPDVRFDLRIDGTLFQSWVVPPQPGFFLQTWTVPEGRLAGDGRFATLSIQAASAGGDGRPVAAAIEQFDLQPTDRLVLGFDEGWYEMEFEPGRGTWRWASDRAVLRIVGSPRDVAITVEGESPLRYFPSSSTVGLVAGDRVLAQTTPAGDFSWTVQVPADALAAGGGRVVLTASQAFSPADRGQSADRRRLGLRISAVRLQPAGIR